MSGGWGCIKMSKGTLMNVMYALLLSPGMTHPLSRTDHCLLHLEKLYLLIGGNNHFYYHVVLDTCSRYPGITIARIPRHTSAFYFIYLYYIYAVTGFSKPSAFSVTLCVVEIVIVPYRISFPSQLKSQNN